VAAASITAVIKSAIDVMLPAAEAKNVEMVFNHESCEDLRVTADVDRLRQVFLNLIANAVKFTPEFGRIEVAARRRGQNVEISIRDNGKGIDPEVLPFIFEKFRQADNSFTRQVGGLGLGLAIVRHLVELHGGTVTAESEGPNRGANFVVTLPLLVHYVRPEERNGFDLARGRNENLLLGVRVLVVEDDADSAEILALILNHSGAQVEIAPSASRAMQAIRDFRPQMLVSDIGLPRQDGYDLIRQVRELPPEDGGLIPAIALTGYASLKDRNDALDAGYQEHLSKPVETEKLIQLITGLLPLAAAQKNPEPKPNS
jgi:CheY-like chemotaxis protein/anti-sigma regulatory factor (Ser/Thr protein kinase)